MRTIALFTTETMADWEYAYLTTQMRGRSSSSPGAFGCCLWATGWSRFARSGTCR